ncbi:MAG: STAS domain-containing protein [Phycisphaerales bacterium]|nr:STAS domain-containing protein [Phycisphaerales bacterium]
MSDEPIIEIRPHERALLIGVLKRSLDEDVTHRLVDDVLTAAAEKHGVPIVLDLSQVKFAPSVAIGALVQLSKSFQLDQRRIALIGVQRRVNEVIRVTQLHRVLEIHDTLESVLDGPGDRR